MFIWVVCQLLQAGPASTRIVFVESELFKQIGPHRVDRHEPHDIWPMDFAVNASYIERHLMTNP